MENICKNCKWREVSKWDSFCTNPKLADETGQDHEFRKDALLYQYSEGGGFIVGDFFGCVHFAAKNKTSV